MIRVAIVEDNQADAKMLSSLIAAWCAENESESISCIVYSDAVKFLEQGSMTSDIVFMDIEMPFMNGMDAAAQFRKYNRDAILIFATRAVKYAVRGYAVDAIGYLVKPIGKESFSDVFEKAIRLHLNRSRQQALVIKVNDGMVKVITDQILYIEAASHQLSIVTEDKTYQVWGGIDKIKESLPGEFVACHRGYIVNLKHIDNVKKDGLSIVGKPGLLIPVSRQKRTEFLEMLTKYYTQAMRG